MDRVPVRLVRAPQAAGSAADVAPAAGQLAAEALGPRNIRFVKTLRIAVTDRCSFRCVYCMPEEGVRWLLRDSLLTYEEIREVVRAALDQGISAFKLTGGEPLLRTDLTGLLEQLRSLPGVGEISLTTNGLLLRRCAKALRDAGLDRLTLSMDTLDRERFRRITRTGRLDRVWEGLEFAEAVGLGPVKINVVVMRDYNLSEVADFAALTFDSRRTVRFIEFMPLGRSRLLTDADQFVPYAEIRARVEQAHGPCRPSEPDAGAGPANLFRLPGAAGKIGFIHAVSAPFCSTCNRLRLTPDGQLRACLFDGGEVDLRPLLRPSLRPADLRQAFVDCVARRPETHQEHGNRQMSRIGG